MDYIKTAAGMFNAGEVLHEYFEHKDLERKTRRHAKYLPSYRW